MYLNFKAIECSWVYAIVAKVLLSYSFDDKTNFCDFQTDSEILIVNAAMTILKFILKW